MKVGAGPALGFADVAATATPLLNTSVHVVHGAGDPADLKELLHAFATSCSRKVASVEVVGISTEKGVDSRLVFKDAVQEAAGLRKVVVVMSS